MRKLFIAVGLFALPVLASAQNLGNVNTLARGFGTLVQTLIPIVFALALLFFFYGLARFILASGDEEKRKQGKDIMIWGVVAIFVMASIWGIVGFIGNAFLGNSNVGGTINSPTVNLNSR